MATKQMRIINTFISINTMSDAWKAVSSMQGTSVKFCAASATKNHISLRNPSSHVARSISTSIFVDGRWEMKNVSIIFLSLEDISNQ